jgi:hypothetical protein
MHWPTRVRPCPRVRYFPWHESFMIKRNIRVTKWMGMLPVIAVCTACGREFRASLTELRQVTAAQESLRRQFDEHVCEEPKPKA